MGRSAIVLLLIVIASLLIFEAFDRNAGAQDVGNISQVLGNQKTIIEKLDAIDKKLDIIRVRIKI